MLILVLHSIDDAKMYEYVVMVWSYHGVNLKYQDINLSRGQICYYTPHTNWTETESGPAP